MTRARVVLVLGACLALLAGATLAGCAGGESDGGIWYCPMHPDYTSDRPGDCPICNMRLVPRPDPEAAPRDSATLGPGALRLESGAAALAGIRTVEARIDTVTRRIRAAGVVQVDETRITQVNARVAGWVERLHVGATGVFVRRGQTALLLYSPELVASQEEFLRARAAAAAFAASPTADGRHSGLDLQDAARRRLELFDVPAGFIAALESTGVVARQVPLLAPISGWVLAKEVVEGQRVEPGMRLYTLADLSHVWVEVALYENEARFVRPGQAATLELAFDPGRGRTGRVTFVYPTLDPATRTLRVRMEFANGDLALKPAMFADVTLDVRAASNLVVPEDAILDSGERQVAFVEVRPHEYEPRDVRTGLRGDGRVEVLAGLAPGERVVVRAAFLLDSEARLRSSFGTPAPAPGHVHEEPQR